MTTVGSTPPAPHAGAFKRWRARLMEIAALPPAEKEGLRQRLGLPERSPGYAAEVLAELRVVLGDAKRRGVVEAMRRWDRAQAERN